MVPFSFENIARSAGLDASNAHAVSDAARATHESFKAHLQRAAPPPRDEPPRSANQDQPRTPSEPNSSKPSHTESVRQDADDKSRDDPTEVQSSDAAEAATAAKQAEERHDEEARKDAASDDAAVIASAADSPPVALHALELDGSPDTTEHTDKAVATKLANEARGDEPSKLDAALTASTTEPADDANVNAGDEAAVGKTVQAIRGEAAATAASDARLKPTTEKEEAARANIETAQSEATTIQQDERAPARKTLRPHRDPAEVSANQQAQESTDAATKLQAADLIEATTETAGDESSRQRDGQKNERDGTQPIVKAATADGATTTPGSPSRFAQHLLARTDSPNARGLSITDADQARFVERVARAVQATGDRGGSLRLRLSPPELGALTLEVKVQGGSVTARVEADTPAARSLLLDNLPLLRERLAEHGMRVDQFDVDLTDQHAGGTPDGPPQNNRQQEDRPPAQLPSLEPDNTPLVTSSEALTKNGNGKLNIII